METVEQWMSDRGVSWPKYPHGDAITAEMASYYSGPPFSKEEIFDVVEGVSKAAIHMMDTPNAWPKEFDDALFIALNTPNAELWDRIKERLQAGLARGGIGDRKAANRLSELPPILCVFGGLRLPEVVVNYLRATVRAYVGGLDAACIALCRSALEAALKARISYDKCVRRLGPLRGRKWRYTFSERLGIAALEGLLNKELTKVAKGICKRGNKVLHEDPKLTQRVDSTIHETARVVCALTTGHDPYPPIPSWASDVPEILD